MNLTRKYIWNFQTDLKIQKKMKMWYADFLIFIWIQAVDWLQESEYPVPVLFHSDLELGWDEIFVRWNEMKSKFLWDETEQNQIFMRWNETESDFYEMRWDRIRMTWDWNEMKLNCDLWDETESESTWNQNRMRLNSYSMKWDEIIISWNQNKMSKIRMR